MAVESTESALTAGPIDVAVDESVEVAPPTPLEFRRAMGMFASGVTVVTGIDDGEPVGFACQSFASVSLEPPLVLFCADRGGRTWPRIRKSGLFCVNVLAEHQVDVCNRFGSSKGKKFDGLEWDVSRWGVPALRGVLVRIHAEVYDVHVAGDHDVVFGHVMELETTGEGRPLVFYRGRFGLDEPQLGPNLWGWGDRWG
ncbi:flavin reductase family protein [Sphaerimonospora thailandensis]|uniref:Oxidoreductase n=1 Tax=Sphaerimonospora thailandensis TaxID=795644 RepID=A0A8J3RCK9_9ACTN|nr:flavin reductase family protein [Sphaerimonospora thailandensis]GIH71349.1 oxidoreductase [Sphaerimonospora thailandensis]